MIIKDVAKLPDLEPGMLVHYKGDSWMQLLSEYSKGTWLVNTLDVDSSGNPVVTWVLEAVDFNGLKHIKSMHWTDRGTTKALARAQILSILGGNEITHCTCCTWCSWYNPEYLPAKKMTVSEIEKELGYRVEVVAEDK